MASTNFGNGYSLEHGLAWELTEAALPLLDRKSRSAIFVALGAGESRDVIGRLLTLIASRGQVLTGELLTRTADWSRCFTDDHDVGC